MLYFTISDSKIKDDLLEKFEMMMNKESSGYSLNKYSVGYRRNDEMFINQQVQCMWLSFIAGYKLGMKNETNNSD